ncbi:MAG: fructose-6-phosphate aldolase [Candidatus Omnitrophota bacterium]|nr:MAG: fructose-6-phosphate aldolase [Candidatus Omnitrophota bacterium]
MKIFLDTANIEQIKEAAELGVIDGVTTNPTLIAREKRNFVDLVREIYEIVDGPISAEVVSLEASGMIDEAQRLAKLGKNIAIKIPMTEEGLKAVKALSFEGIMTNVTLCFSPAQGLLAAKAGATFLSPFIGRLDDVSHEGMNLVRTIKQIYANYGYKTQIIVASIRHPLHVLEAATAGADIATVPFDVLKKLLKHPLTDIGIDRFLQDWQKLTDKEKAF